MTEPANMTEPASPSHAFWPQLKRLAIFQLKLYMDALRDLIMSPLSIGAFVLDLVQGKTGEDSNFEDLLRLGRKSERMINLFNQHDSCTIANEVESAFNQMEENIARHYRDGTLSEAAKQALDKAMGGLRGKQ